MAVDYIKPHPKKGEPVWDIAHLFPLQGAWSEEDYLSLETNHLIEFSDGNIEVLPMPSERHQDIVIFLMQALIAFAKPRDLGKVLVAAFRVKLWEGKYREPDVMFLLKENYHKRGKQFWHGADLVMEVVSPDDPKRDTEKKYQEYAKAGISEYWIVNPLDETIRVFTLPESADSYQLHGEFKHGEVATSDLLNGFSIKVTEALKHD